MHLEAFLRLVNLPAELALIITCVHVRTSRMLLLSKTSCSSSRLQYSATVHVSRIFANCGNPTLAPIGGGKQQHEPEPVASSLAVQVSQDARRANMRDRLCLLRFDSCLSFRSSSCNNLSLIVPSSVNEQPCWHELRSNSVIDCYCVRHCFLIGIDCRHRVTEKDTRWL